MSICCWALLCRATLSAAIGGGGQRPEENTRKSSLIVPLGPSLLRSPPSVAQWPTVDSALGQDLDSEREREKGGGGGTWASSRAAFSPSQSPLLRLDRPTLLPPIGGGFSKALYYKNGDGGCL